MVNQYLPGGKMNQFIQNQPMNAPLMPVQMPAIQSIGNLASQMQGPQLTGVNGMDGAKAFATQPNSKYALFDLNDDVFYIKSTDANNYPSIERFRFYREAEPEPPRYVTMEDLERFKEEILNAQQSVRSGQNNSGGNNRQQTSRTENNK